MVSILLGCGLRRAELAGVAVHDIQQREEHWVFADLVGKCGHIRTLPIPEWVAVHEWLLEQIHFLLGHVSVETTERYLGCKQCFRNAVNDHIGIEPEP